MHLVINKVVYTPSETLEEDLYMEYCLPEWFWTRSEWAKFITRRNRLRKLIQQEIEYGRLRNEYSKDDEWQD